LGRAAHATLDAEPQLNYSQPLSTGPARGIRDPLAPGAIKTLITDYEIPVANFGLSARHSSPPASLLGRAAHATLDAEPQLNYSQPLSTGPASGIRDPLAPGAIKKISCEKKYLQKSKINFPGLVT